jgi:hypothetical protein
VKLIETKVLASAAASISFTSIPQTFTDLVMVISTRSDSANSGFPWQQANLSVNGNTASLTGRQLYGLGNSVASNTYSGSLLADWGQSTATVANTFSNSIVYFPNYTLAINKSISIDAVQESNGTSAAMGIIAGLWSNTAAITSLTLTTGIGNFVATSSISLYGVTSGSDGIVTVA